MQLSTYHPSDDVDLAGDARAIEAERSSDVDAVRGSTRVARRQHRQHRQRRQRRQRRTAPLVRPCPAPDPREDKVAFQSPGWIGRACGRRSLRMRPPRSFAKWAPSSGASNRQRRRTEPTVEVVIAPVNGGCTGVRRHRGALNRKSVAVPSVRDRYDHSGGPPTRHRCKIARLVIVDRDGVAGCQCDLSTALLQLSHLITILAVLNGVVRPELVTVSSTLSPCCEAAHGARRVDLSSAADGTAPPSAGSWVNLGQHDGDVVTVSTGKGLRQ